MESSISITALSRRLRDPETLVLEGRFIVERVISLGFTPSIIAATPSMMTSLAASLDPARTTCLRLGREALSRVAGYDFHRGCIGILDRPPRSRTPEEIGRFLDSPPAPSRPPTVVALSRITDPHNLGVILRTCVALGVSQVVMSQDSAPIWSRRVIRTSMGNVFAAPPTRVADLRHTLRSWRAHHDVHVVAASLAPDAVPLNTFCRPPGPLVLVLGNEGHGLDDDITGEVDTSIVIPVVDASDSLNVSVAAGILIERLRAP